MRQQAAEAAKREHELELARFAATNGDGHTPAVQFSRLKLNLQKKKLSPVSKMVS